MPILKEAFFGASNVPVSFHVLVKSELYHREGFALLGVVSFVSEADYLAGKQQACSWQHSVHLNEFMGLDAISDNLERALTLRPDLPFYGGQLVVDMADTPQGARERAWAAVKFERDKAMAGSFAFEGEMYQVNRDDIPGSVVGAYSSLQQALPYTKEWTLTDNTVRVLTAEQVIALGLAQEAYIDAVHAKARCLRALIAAAATVEEADRVVWRAYSDQAPFECLLP